MCFFANNDNKCKSYVHGNLDAVAYNNSKIETEAFGSAG